MEQGMPAGVGRKASIRYTIFTYFTISALAVILLIGVTLYAQMSQQLKVAVREENQAVLGQINRSVDAYLRTIMKLSDSLYYGVIKNAVAMALEYRVGSYRERYEGEWREVSVKSVGYTGWKLLSVTPEKGLPLSNLKMQLFAVFVVAAFLLVLVITNTFISSRITTPIQELEKSVNAIEAGDLDTEVYMGGSYERVQYLAISD